ncbi:P-loop containing nucleoside triphosphate hydrolase protein [Umbelopsis sp. PMI_123]|nr:P-loop containing nucleoside triphosphate hydrolase protein [Umbelopsis sp. PMI_123]
MSSLFTSNPTIERNYKAKTVVHRGDVVPSNAPVADNTTFVGIGIEPDLVEHMTNKLSITTPTNIQKNALPILLGPSRTVLDAKIPSKDVDVVVQAQTGSGKTLTYLLPIVNRLISASTSTGSAPAFGDRTVGTVAIILTPTRELAQQVLNVLTTILSIPPSKTPGKKRTHWIVPGIVIGGDKKSSEKARLRKGVNILVSTPGRLLDHLQNTKSFSIENLKWLVLDEADRLLDLGFEETLKNIMKIIDERTAVPGKFKQTMANKFWPKRRQTVLCSATLRDDVQKLAGQSLVDPVFVSGNGDVSTMADATHGMSAREDDAKFTTPNQLKQTCVLTPAKLRLVTLLAMLKSCYTTRKGNRLSHKNNKVIVFFSCCDSVDFHYDLFVNAGKQKDEGGKDNDDDEDPTQKILREVLDGQQPKKKQTGRKSTTSPTQQANNDMGVNGTSKLLNHVSIFRLHGDLSQAIRSQTYQEFGKAESGVLLCTDVAARGLDLPDVNRIIQYDAPSDLKDYVHRVGRTARLGKAGEASLFLLPSEMEYLDILKAQDLHASIIPVEMVLSHLITNGNSQDYQTPSQELQNMLEQCVLSSAERMNLARKSYWSSVRAYTTHPAAEKHIFHIKKLHLGHYAKSFAMREAPSDMNETNSKTQKKRQQKNERLPGMNTSNNRMKRKYDHASEFAISGAASMVGPRTKRNRK